MTDPAILLGWTWVVLGIGIVYTVHQVQDVRSAAEEARAYAERNGDDYPFEVDE